MREQQEQQAQTQAQAGKPALSAETQPAAAPVFAFTLTLQATEAQFAELLAYMRTSGIKGSFKKNVTASV